MYREIIAICSQIHTEYINTPRGQDRVVQFETQFCCTMMWGSEWETAPQWSV